MCLRSRTDHRSTVFFLKAGFPTLCADNLKGLQIIIPAIFHTHFRENGQQANYVPVELRGVQV